MYRIVQIRIKYLERKSQALRVFNLDNPVVRQNVLQGVKVKHFGVFHILKSSNFYNSVAILPIRCLEKYSMNEKQQIRSGA